METSIRASESPDEAVRSLVANHENCRPSELGNLDGMVDVTALNQIRNPPVGFRYCGYQVTVTADESIEIES